MHKHNYNLTKQVNLPFFTTRNYYECECGDKYNEYENPVGTFTINQDGSISQQQKNK